MPYVGAPTGGSGGVASPDTVLTSKANTYGNFNQLFRSGRLHIRNPADTAEYWIHGDDIVGDLDLILPQITDTDHLVAELAPATLAYKVLDATCDISDTLGGATITGVGMQSGAIVDINTTASETDLLNYTVPGGSMCVNGSVRFVITGYILANSGAPTYTFIVKFGGTNLISCISSAFGAAATKFPFRIQGEIFNKNATNAQGASMNIICNDLTAITTGIGSIADDTTKWRGNSDSEGADTTKDTTIDQILRVTVTMSVNNSAVHTVVKHKQAEVFQHT